MATKIERITAELDAANIKLATTQNELANVTKERDSAKTLSSYRDTENTRLQEEIEQMHTLLDALPGCIPRQTIIDEYGSKKRNSPFVRFAAYLATRGAA